MAASKKTDRKGGQGVNNGKTAEWLAILRKRASGKTPMENVMWDDAKN